MEEIPTYNYVKSKPIDIFNKLPTQNKSNELTYDYASFNPNKDSPPNLFLKKLRKRLDNYYNKPFILNNT